MIAWAMQQGMIDLFTSAADTITRDGHIANKIGTFQIALLADHFGIPYYVTGIPDRDKLTKDDIVIEMRDPAQVLEYRGIRNCLPGVNALYPAFDVVPPELIAGVVTDRGVYAAAELCNIKLPRFGTIVPNRGKTVDQAISDGFYQNGRVEEFNYAFADTLRRASRLLRASGRPALRAP